jgi:hypothetical protein
VADQRHRLAGLRDERQIVHGGAVAAVGQAHPLELDPPLHVPERDRARLLDQRRGGVEHGEELGEPRRMEEQPVDEANRLVDAADQLARQTHEGDDLPDRGPVV